MSPAALDLAERLLNFDPEQRVTASDALQAPYFTQEQPMAELPTGYVFNQLTYTTLSNMRPTAFLPWMASGTS